MDADSLLRNAYKASCRGDLEQLVRISEALGKEQFKGYRDPSGMGFLHKAAEAGHTSLVRWLVSIGYDVDDRSKQYKTPAMLAASEGHLEALTIIIDACPSAIQSHKKQGWSCLMFAAAHGHLAVVQYLLAHGALLTDRNKEGATALYLACREGHMAVAAALLDAGANPVECTNSGRTPLIAAAAAGHTAIALLLLNRGVDASVGDKGGLTAIHECAHNCHVQCFQAILDALSHPTASSRLSAPVKDQVDSIGRTALHYAALADGGEGMVCALVASGWLVDARDERDATPLYYATTMGHTAAMRLLLDAGADPMAKTTQRSCLHGAMLQDHADALEILLTSCLTEKEERLTNTARLSLSDYSDSQKNRLQQLLSERDYEGKTVIQVASERGSAKCVQLLSILGE